jgi:UDP-N-acetylmuramoylalanine--D-glutamate ligase
MAEQLKAQIVFFSRKTDADICVKDGKIISKKHGVIIPVDEIPIPGVHNIENVLAAVALSLCCDVPVDVIRCIVRNFSGVEHRIEFVREINGVKYYNDSKATNVDSALVALDALAAPLIVIAGGRDKDLDFKPFAQKLKERTKLLVLIGETAQKISVACDNEGFHEYIFAASMKNAVDICRKNAVKGDCVLLSPACASFDMFTSYEHRGKVFKEAVNND